MLKAAQIFTLIQPKKIGLPYCEFLGTSAGLVLFETYQEVDASTR